MTETPPDPTGSGPAGGGGTDDGTRVPLGVLVAAAVAACEEAGVFRAAAPCGLADDDLLAGLAAAERLGRLVDGVRIQVAGEVAARSRRELGEESLARRQNFSTPIDLIAGVALVSRSTANARIKLGSRVVPSVMVGKPVPSQFPEVEDALRSGLIGVDTAEAITRPLAQAAPTCGTEDIRAAEQQLVDWAVDGIGGVGGGGGVSFTADQIRGLAIRARENLDADGAEPRYQDLEAQRGLSFSKMRSGCIRVTGVLTPDQGATWMAIDHAVSSPRVSGRVSFDRDVATRVNADEDVNADADADEVDPAPNTAPAGPDDCDHLAQDADPDVVDTRTVAQRRADVFTDLMRAAAALPGMPQINGAAPVLNVHANLDDVITGRGVGWIDGVDEPLPATVIEQLICHGDVVTTLFGRYGQVLQHGKTKRLFTPAQNRALANRDGGCVWKGCDRPPQFCESHHVNEWKDDGYLPGRTDVCNGVLLCGFHHRHLHRTDWKLVMINGVPHLIPPSWVDHQQRPQRCRQASDRLTTTPPPPGFNPRQHATPPRPLFTDTD